MTDIVAPFLPGYQPAAQPSSGIPFAPQFGGFGAQPLAMPTNQGQGGLWDMFRGAVGKMGSPGFQSGISAFSNLANIYAGFKSLGLAEDQLDFTKDSFNRNFGAQARAYNNELKDRWEARRAGAAARGRGYEGMDAWLRGRTIEEG